MILSGAPDMSSLEEGSMGDGSMGDGSMGEEDGVGVGRMVSLREDIPGR